MFANVYEKAKMDGIQKFLIIFGLILLLLGLLWPFLRDIGLGRLPGDIHLGGKGWSVHILLGTSILLSIVLTVILNIIVRFFDK